MNNDLRYHEDEKQTEDGYVVSVSQSTDKTKESSKKTVSFISIVLGMFKRENDDEKENTLDKPIPFPRPQITLKFLFFSVCVAIILFLSYYFVNLRALLILTLVLVAMVLPMVAIVFFYELNTRCDIKAGYLIMCFFAGSVLYLLVFEIGKYISLTLVFDSMNSVLSGIVVNLIKLVVAIFMIKILKVKEKLSGILVVVTLYMGFSFSRTLECLFSNLFIETISEGKVYYVLINDVQYLRESMHKLLSKSLYYGFFFTLIDLGSAIVVGYDLVTVENLLYKGEDYPKSIYLTVVIVVILASLFEINSMISLVKYVFKIFSTMMVATLAIQTLNQAINDENFESE